MIYIGGPPGSGKTTVAGRLARRHGLRLYSADTRTWVHRARLAERGSTAAAAWDMRAIELGRERGPLVREDVEALPAQPLVVAEGTCIPANAAPGLWLIPTADWQRAQLAARGTPAHVVEIYEEMRLITAAEAGDVLTVDGSLTIDETVAAVERHFADELAGNEPGDRAALAREANLDIVRQMRTAATRPWHEGDPDDTVRAFWCECGDPACTATVETTVREAARAPVLS